MPRKTREQQVLEKLLDSTDPQIQLKAAVAIDRIRARRERRRKKVAPEENPLWKQIAALEK